MGAWESRGCRCSFGGSGDIGEPAVFGVFEEVVRGGEVFDGFQGSAHLRLLSMTWHSIADFSRRRGK